MTGSKSKHLNLLEFRQLVKGDEDLRIVTLEHITRVYGISDRTLKRHIAAKTLRAVRAVRAGRRYRVTITNLKRYLNGGEGVE